MSCGFGRTGGLGRGRSCETLGQRALEAVAMGLLVEKMPW